MNENTTKLIEQLAQKMGTTSEYLWSILLRQAPVDAMIGTTFILLSIVAAFLMWKLNLKFMQPYSDGSLQTYYDDNDALPIFMFAASFAVALCLLFSIINLPNIFAGFFNPEYWALNKIMETLK